MKKETIIKLQIIFICLSIFGFEFALYLWKPTLITIALLIGINGLIGAFLIEALTKANYDSRL